MTTFRVRSAAMAKKWLPPAVLALFLLLLFLFTPPLSAQSQDTPFTFVPSTCFFTIDNFGEELSPEDSGFKCGYVVVPEQHSQPNGSTIRIPVAILEARAPNGREPLFLAQGGPGGDAFGFFSSPSVQNSLVIQNRDIVIFNQRGTLYAEPELTCAESFDAAGEILELPEEAAEEKGWELFEQCYQRLQTEGVNFSAFNSLENAADVPAIAQALAYETYSFYGVSYGTLLGQHLLNLRPDGLETVILDGVVPTDLNFIPYVPKNQDRIFGEMFNLCLQDSACNQQYPNLEARFWTLKESWDQNPVTISLTDEETGETYDALVDGDGLVNFFFQVFYMADAYALFPRLIADIEGGNYGFMQYIWPFFAFDRTFSEGMYYSVICSEDADFDPNKLPLEGIRPQFAETAAEDMELYLKACDIWQVDVLPNSVDNPVQTGLPVLLLSGRFDPITPPYFAEQVLPHLPNGYHFVDPYGSHGVAFGNECIDQIVLDFLAEPTAEPDSYCLSVRPSEDFVPADAVSLPAFLAPLNQAEGQFMAELGFSLLLLLIVGLSIFVWILAFLIRLVMDNSQRPPWTNTQIALRLLNRTVLIGFATLGGIFFLMLAFTIYNTIFEDSMILSALALPASFAPWLMLPYLLVGLGFCSLLLTAGQWVTGAGSIWSRLYDTFVLLCAFGHLFLLYWHGLL